MQPVIRQILQGRYQATNRQGQTQNFDDHIEAVAFSETGTMIEYKGFEITPTFQIFKNGKQVFTAHWQRCHTLEQAQIMIDASIMADSLPATPAVVRAVLAYDEREAAKELEEMKEAERIELYNEIENQKR